MLIATMMSPRTAITTTTPTRLAHVPPLSPMDDSDDMVSVAIGASSEPISTIPMANAMIVMTTELMDRP